MNSRFLASFLLIMVFCDQPVRAESTPNVALGSTIPECQLKDIDDNTRSLAELCKESKAVVLAFIGIDCPLNTSYMPRLVELAKGYAPRGVTFIGVNSNQHDSLLAVTKHARAFEVSFPVCKDFGNKIADELGAMRTPEVAILDSDRVLRYRGRIDDQYGYTPEGQSFIRPKPTRHDLAEALNEILAGKEVTVPSTEVDGCLISREVEINDPETITYNEHIAKIIQTKCMECHREGQIAPFALTNYDEVAGWGLMINEVVRERRMPPWHADPSHGQFRNDRALSGEEIHLIEQWVENGMPRGEGKPPTPPTFAKGWINGEPDLVFHMEKPFTVPAKGTIDYQWVSIDPKLTEDIWVQAVELRPGNPSVVHHILMFVLPPDQRRLSDEQRAGYFAAYAPGNNPRVFPKGYAKKIRAGSKIVFQLHYTANGVEQDDRSYVGLILSREKEHQSIRTLGIANGGLYLPAGQARVSVQSSHRLSQDVLLLGLMPHTHLRGKSFRYEAHYPDGKVQTLLNVPRYDFNWQTSYELAKPVRLPKDTTIVCEATYDNSENNPNNPDPTKNVRWGPQTWDEMMIGYIDYIPLEGKVERQSRRDRGNRTRATAIKTLFTLLDKNGDGELVLSEMPEKYRRSFPKLLKQFDQNKDRKLTRGEVLGNNE